MDPKDKEFLLIAFVLFRWVSPVVGDSDIGNVNRHV